MFTIDFHVYIKSTREYGKISIFHGDDEYMHKSYYRSDKLFKKEEVLHTLDISLLIPGER